jgi:hypothetical protein
MVWMHKFGSGGVREIYYQSLTFAGGAWIPEQNDTSGVAISGANGGYCNVDVWEGGGGGGNGVAVPAWHEGPTQDSYSIYSGIDVASGSGVFIASAAPLENCQSQTTGGDDGYFSYIWPKHHVDYDIGADPNPVIHVVGCEPTDDILQSMVVFRGVGNPTDYGTCGLFFDSVTVVSPVIRQDPTSDNVALVYARPVDQSWEGANQYNNDIVYYESHDGGVTWWDFVNVTNYQEDELERAYANLSAMYTSDGCLHIVWDAIYYNQAEEEISAQTAKLRHWDDCNNCISLVANADNYHPDCDCGRFNRNISKPNLTECDNGNLYVTYTRFLGDEDGTPHPQDCSANGWANGELFLQASSTGGETWGPPINLSSTFSDGCAAGGGESEHWSSAAMYGDSTYIQYIYDTDAGGAPAGEGSWTSCPVQFYVHPCVEMDTYVELTGEPDEFAYPFNVIPGVNIDTSFTLTNSGNVSALYTSSVTYISGSGWLNINNPSGNVSAGCANDTEVGMTVWGPATEGLYQAEMNVNYSKAELTIPVDIYVFDPFWLPENVRLRTAWNVMNVAQDSRAADQDDISGITWFADTATYLFDGSLLLRDGSGDWSFNIFHDISDFSTFDNPWKKLYANSDVTVDTTWGSPLGYRSVSGSGVNGDSTLQFDLEWMASYHPDTASFMVAHVAVGWGPNFPGGTMNDVVIAYACDFDVPSDTGADNLAFVDAAEQTVYQQGQYSGSPDLNDQRYAGIAYRGKDAATEFADGGLVWDNERYVYPQVGYDVDSLEKYLPGFTGWQTMYSDTHTITDMNSIIVVDNDATIGAKDNLEFCLVFWSINPNEPSADQDYVDILDKAETFICSYVPGFDNAPYCDTGPDYICGDADGNAFVTVSDAIWIIQYILGEGPEPDPWQAGDADSCGSINIADAVVIICWIFADGAPPCDPSHECFHPTPGENYVILDCPVTVEDPDGDSISVTLRFTNDVPITGLSLGFSYDSDDVEVSSVDFSNSVLPYGFGGYLVSLYSETNEVLIGWAGIDCAGFPAQSDGELAKLWFQIPPGTPSQAIDIESTFVAPSNEFLFSSNGGSVVPEYVDCGSADLIITSASNPICNNSFTDPAFLICPGGDAEFEVFLRNQFDEPVPGINSVWVEFVGCDELVPCSDAPPMDSIAPLGPSDEAGVMRFVYPAGGCDGDCYAVVKIPDGRCDIATVPVLSFDVNGDTGVSMDDWDENSSCCDYNSSGVYNDGDFALFAPHLTHYCGLSPCERFSSEFTLTPPGDHTPGQTIELDFILTNNNFDSCHVYDVEIFYTPTGTGQTETSIYWENYDQTLAPGEEDTISCDYTIPANGDGCLIARCSTSCCSTLVEKSACIVGEWHCAADTTYCYEFYILISGNPPVSSIYVNEENLQGWPFEIKHWPDGPWPLQAPDFIQYEICTVPGAELGDRVWLTTLLFQQGFPPVREVVNAVWLTPQTGDCDGNCLINVSDIVYLIQYVFGTGPGPLPEQAGDVDCTGFVNVSDIVLLINYVFGEGPPPCLVNPYF